MKRLALIGASGQLGRDLSATAEDHGWSVVPLDHAAIEIADADSVRRALGDAEPSVVVNTAACQGAAAYGAEDQAAFFRVNALGAWNLGRWCAEHGVGLVHYSTDYVFGGGTTTRPLVERDPAAPLNVYGASKLAGEHLLAGCGGRHWILRVASLYGHGGCRAKGDTNFVDGVLARAAGGETLRMVDDQTMSPTATIDVARATLAMLDADAPSGLYHAAGRGACTWYEFASEILRIAGLDAAIERCSTPPDPPGTAFVRPRYSALDNAALREAGLADLPPWQESLSRYLAERLARHPLETPA